MWVFVSIRRAPIHKLRKFLDQIFRFPVGGKRGFLAGLPCTSACSIDKVTKVSSEDQTAFDNNDVLLGSDVDAPIDDDNKERSSLEMTSKGTVIITDVSVQ